MTDDPTEQMRQRVAQLSPEELKATLATILEGGFIDPPDALHTLPLPELPEAPGEPSALTVRVDIHGMKPPIWRRLVLRGDLTLDQVHAVLQEAFGWLDSHLHHFTPGPPSMEWRAAHFLTEFDVDEGEEGILEGDVRLDQVLLKPGDQLTYTYDFGDNWTHSLRLESIDPLDVDAPPAVCTGGRMAGPLEDSGGIGGYSELVEAHRADPALSGLEDYVRDWVPPGWDPGEFDVVEANQQLSLVGLDADDVMAAMSREAGLGQPVDWPEALEPLRELAPPAVATELSRLCVQARSERDSDLTAEDLAVIARPFRYLVDLAGDDGIPLTSAGWMKPAVVEQVYVDLDFDAEWIGKGNREDQTLPVAQLRAMAQQLGLLRKHKGKLLRTRLAQSLSTDEDYVAAIAARLLHDKHPYQRATMALFALFTAATGKAVPDHCEPIADLLTACGLRTGPSGAERWHMIEHIRPVWMTLDRAAGRSRRRDALPLAGHRAVALARMALWPEG